ncbi:uncharacterized protein [Anabrus simplex]|uniref:uncharacterized protein n=1 Tax=Anabrus simplex TaxID=316456 RepID=UPI0034DDA5C3
MAVERQSLLSRSPRECVARLCGCLVPALVPPLHVAVLYYAWRQFARSVDKHYCTCSCWDTVFKGTYESGVASYKHMYFNATKNSMKIWVTTVICIISLYECVRYLVNLLLERHMRLSMLTLFLSSIYAHYYSWWAYINYWNDDFYSQWNHQMFFTITELASTVLVLQLADSRKFISTRKALGISGIALLHVLAGGWDQFVMNVFRGAGHVHQVVRDLGLMVPDLLHVVLPLLEVRSRMRVVDKELAKELILILIFIAVGFLICSQL